jgi:hypothetical protein
MSFFKWETAEGETIMSNDVLEQKMTECLLPGSWAKLKEKFKAALTEGTSFEEEVLLKEGFEHAR